MRCVLGDLAVQGVKVHGREEPLPCFNLELLEWARRRRFAPFSLALDRRVRGPAERNARPVPNYRYSKRRLNEYLNRVGHKRGNASILFRFNREAKLVFLSQTCFCSFPVTTRLSRFCCQQPGNLSQPATRRAGLTHIETRTVRFAGTGSLLLNQENKSVLMENSTPGGGLKRKTKGACDMQAPFAPAVYNRPVVDSTFAGEGTGQEAEARVPVAPPTVTRNTS